MSCEHFEFIVIETAAASSVLFYIVKSDISPVEHNVWSNDCFAVTNTGTDRYLRDITPELAELTVDPVYLVLDQFLRIICNMDHQDKELITADTAYVVIGTERLDQRIRNPLKGFVACLMPACIVDLMIIAVVVISRLFLMIS